MFGTKSALTLHLESGSCPSGLDRKSVARRVIELDTSRFITNGARLLTYGQDEYWATERCWNGEAYECYLCHSEMRTLHALNQHLRSPRHDQKIYKFV